MCFLSVLFESDIQIFIFTGIQRLNKIQWKKIQCKSGSKLHYRGCAPFHFKSLTLSNHRKKSYTGLRTTNLRSCKDFWRENMQGFSKWWAVTLFLQCHQCTKQCLKKTARGSIVINYHMLRLWKENLNVDRLWIRLLDAQSHKER